MAAKKRSVPLPHGYGKAPVYFTCGAPRALCPRGWWAVEGSTISKERCGACGRQYRRAVAPVDATLPDPRA